jgi:Haemolymph juvenile hormone binding protein (JHBP).
MYVSPCFRFDFDKLTFSIQLLVPKLGFSGKYQMSGKMATLPISGKGETNVTLGWYH